MGWAKYDEDNRDYMEERCSMMGNYPMVFNYTASYWSKQKTKAHKQNQCIAQAKHSKPNPNKDS